MTIADTDGGDAETTSSGVAVAEDLDSSATSAAISALHDRLAGIDELDLDGQVDALEELNRQIVAQLSALEEL